MKKFFAALLAVMLVFSLCVTASADPIDVSDHSFKAYQIFSGNVSNGVISDIAWGEDVTGTAFLSALKSATTFGETNPFAACSSAADVANALTEGNAQAFAEFAATHLSGNGTDTGETVPGAGYYLVVDETTVAGAVADAKNLTLLKLADGETFEVTSKVDVPTFEKKVKDVNDSTDAAYSDWLDGADWDMGDQVPFKLEATLGTIADYDTYKVVFTDTPQAGSFGEPKNVKVYIGSIAEANEVTSAFTSTYAEGVLTVSCDNVKAASVGATDGSKIIVTYDAKLLTTAVIGNPGNWNAAYLEYSNDVDVSGSTGKTPEDQVVVYTYEIEVNKIDVTGEALKGAGFTLSKLNAESGEYEVIGNEIKGENMVTFNWVGVDDGQYKLEETTTPAGYNTMAPQLFTVSATHGTEGSTAAELAVTELTATGFTSPVELADSCDAEGNFVLTGTIEADVTNFAGSTLPETGGRGTTIFYAVGSVMVVAAVILLLTKKRMVAEG